jgi:serine/threonine protein kinase
VTSDSDDLVGRTVLGRYRVVLPLGSGGQGTVYLARGEGAAGFARPVVIKQVLARFSGDSRALDTFAREARIMSQLRHPNIVSVIDFERSGDSYLMVLEYVHGYDLKRWAHFVWRQHGRFSPQVVAHMMMRVLEALHYAHTLRAPDGSPRRVIHRDVSPANVLVDVNGQVKLTDFGVARMDAEEVTDVTTHLKIKGKLAYVAPELYRGEQPSVATDVYACGVMMHELLLGKNEFRGETALQNMRLSREHVGTRIDAVRDDVSRAFADVVARALAKTPGERFESAFEFAQAVAATLRGQHGDLEARFRAVVREDFTNPRFAPLLGATPLSELDAAWRAEPDLAERLEPARPDPTPSKVAAAQPRSGTGALTVVASPLSRRLRDSDRPESTPWSPAVIVMTVALAAAVLVAGLLAFRTTTSEPPRFVYVHREPTPAPAGAAVQLPETVVTSSAAGDIVTRPAQGEKPRPGKPIVQSLAPAQQRAEQLSAAFATRRDEVESCFAREKVAAGARLGVEVEFVIGTDGRVQRASIHPQELARSALGRCVVTAALATRFGPQPSELVARIPVTARAVK